MSTLKNLFLLVMILSPVLSIAQQGGIEAALQKGNATELATFFSKNVDIFLALWRLFAYLANFI